METGLDRAYRAMMDGGEAERRAYYARLVASELHVLLESDGKPSLIEMDGSRYVLAFDSDTRLARFTETAAERAVMPGRALVAMLAGQSCGIGVNLGVSDTAMAVPVDAVTWMAERVAGDVAPATPPRRFTPPDLPEAALGAIDGWLAGLPGAAKRAYLVGTDQGPALVFEGADPLAERGLAQGLSEFCALAGLGPIDAIFAMPGPVLEAAARIGLGLDLPAARSLAGSAAPGSNPDKPPRLR